MPCYRVTGEEGTPVYLTVASYFGEQNLFLYTLWLSLPSNLCNLHPTPVSLSLRHLSPQTQLCATSVILFISTLLSVTSPSHLSTKCLTFSTSLKLHWPQILSSLFSPIHLPVSTLNSAVPPLNFAIIHLSSFLTTCTHLTLHPPSIRFFTIPNFDLP